MNELNPIVQKDQNINLTYPEADNNVRSLVNLFNQIECVQTTKSTAIRPFSSEHCMLNMLQTVKGLFSKLENNPLIAMHINENPNIHNAIEEKNPEIQERKQEIQKRNQEVEEQYWSDPKNLERRKTIDELMLAPLSTENKEIFNDYWKILYESPIFVKKHQEMETDLLGNLCFFTVFIRSSFFDELKKIKTKEEQGEKVDLSNIYNNIKNQVKQTNQSIQKAYLEAKSPEEATFLKYFQLKMAVLLPIRLKTSLQEVAQSFYEQKMKEVEIWKGFTEDNLKTSVENCEAEISELEERTKKLDKNRSVYQKIKSINMEQVNKLRELIEKNRQILHSKEKLWEAACELTDIDPLTIKPLIQLCELSRIEKTYIMVYENLMGIDFNFKNKNSTQKEKAFIPSQERDIACLYLLEQKNSVTIEEVE